MDDSNWSIEVNEQIRQVDSKQEKSIRKQKKQQKITSSQHNSKLKNKTKFQEQEQQIDRFISNNILDAEQLKTNYSFYQERKEEEYQVKNSQQLSIVKDEQDLQEDQLKPDQKITDMSMWDVKQVKTDQNKKDSNFSSNQKHFGQKERGNRKKKQQDQQQPKKRGNRQINNQPNKPYCNPVHQVPQGRKETNIQNNDSDNNSQKRRGNRVFSQAVDNQYRGRGGRNRGAYRKNYNDRGYYGQNSGQNYYQNSERGDFKKKSTYQQKLQNQTERNNFEYKGRNRGGYRQGDKNNYYNRNYDRNYDNNYRNRNNNYNNYHYQKKQPQVVIKQVIVQKQVPKEIEKEVIVYVEHPKNYPKCRKCWPSQSIIILGCQVSVTLRKIQSFKNDILVVPYRQPKFDLYPGNFVLKSTADYKKKITQKGEKLQKDGSVYIQKCVGIDNFMGFAFLKIMDLQKSVKNGVKQLLREVGKLKQAQKPIKSIIFPVCKQLGDPKIYIKQFFQQIQNFSKVEEIIITTEIGQLYCKLNKTFADIVSDYIQENDITIY